MGERQRALEQQIEELQKLKQHAQEQDRDIASQRK